MDSKRPPAKRTDSKTGDFALVGAAQRLVQGALGLVAGERLLLVTDRARAALVPAIRDAVEGAAGSAAVVVLEDLAPRPMGRLHETIVQEIQHAQASVALF